MYYEFYIDVFFVVNLVMNFFMLRLVTRVGKGTATSLRSLLGAALGAAGLCAVILLPAKSPFLQTGVSQLILGIIMVRIGCGPAKVRVIAERIIILYAVSFLTGGILTAVPESTKEGIATFFVFTAAAYWMIVIGMRLLKYLKGKSSAICEVLVRTGGKCVKVKGLYDTGNRLYDAVTKSHVCVMEYAKFREVLKEEEKNCFDRLIEHQEGLENGCIDHILSFAPHYLTYRSVGKEQGLMLAVTVDELVVSSGEENRQVKRAVLGLTRNRLSGTGNFQIIVNPGILDS